MCYRLAIDLGTTSLGWAAYRLDHEGEPTEILRTGVHIFADGRKANGGTSLKAERREHRQTRRMRDRYKERMRLLMNRLVASELMPSDVSARKLIEQYDPYPLRKSALDMQIAPYDMGRAIYHLAQRRGFKSNRKTDGGEDGTIRKSVKQFQENLEHCLVEKLKE